MKLGQYNSALNDLNNVNSINKSPTTYKNMAKCREKLGNITEALSSYQEALKLCGTDKIEAGKILLERGRLYMLQGKPDLAFRDFDDALTNHEKLDKLPLAEVSRASK
jgi:tetratricopeptide (TPR) repeat protein